MDNWGIDALIHNGGVMILEPEITKKEQLKIAFTIILNKHFIDTGCINGIVNELLKEVSIRTPLK